MATDRPMRTAYVLTTNKQSERTLFTESVLTKIGFTVKLIQHTPHEDKVLSNKLSMINIYRQIRDSGVNYAYVFEDDINMLEPIELDEIIQYETISPMFFYLGMCKYNNEAGIYNTTIQINSHPVIRISNYVRGLHAIGISNRGVTELLHFIETQSYEYMDMILENFTRDNPANIVRYDLESYISGHRGILFQDRNRFPSTI